MITKEIMAYAKRILSIWIRVYLLSIAVILPVAAREKTDLVILKNGNRINCEIKSLARGMLSVGTDSMSTVQIKWEDVESISSKFQFTVRDNEGQVYVGSLEATGSARQVNIVGPRPTSNLDHLSIVELQELGSSRWKRLSGSTDLSYSFTKASDRKQLNFSGDLKYRTEHYSGAVGYSSTIGTSKGQTDADRTLMTISGTRDLSRKWVAYGQTSFEHNLELQLDRRFSFLGGPGYRIAESNNTLVMAIAAAALTRESYYGEGSAKNAEGFFGLDAEFFRVSSPKVNIVNQFVYLPNFTTEGRRRLEFNTKIRLEVLRDFFVTVTFYDTYDSRPPSETAAKNDYGFTTGLSWSFRK